AGHLTYPELAAAVDRATVALLRDRGEPAGLTRVACAVVMELASSGLLRRLGHVRGGESPRGSRAWQADDDAAAVGDARAEREDRGDRGERRAGGHAAGG